MKLMINNYFSTFLIMLLSPNFLTIGAKIFDFKLSIQL